MVLVILVSDLHGKSLPQDIDYSKLHGAYFVGLGDYLPDSLLDDIRYNVVSKEKLSKIRKTIRSKEASPDEKNKAVNELRKIDKEAFSNLTEKNIGDIIECYETLKEQTDELKKKGIHVRVIHGNRDFPEYLKKVFGKQYKKGEMEKIGEKWAFYYPNACKFGYEPVRPGEVSIEERKKMIKQCHKRIPDIFFCHTPPAGTPISTYYGKEVGDEVLEKFLRKINTKRGQKKIQICSGHLHQAREENILMEIHILSVYPFCLTKL